jgi:hypothetical protein
MFFEYKVELAELIEFEYHSTFLPFIHLIFLTRSITISIHYILCWYVIKIFTHVFVFELVPL